MNKTIKEIIIETIKAENICTEDELKKRINMLELDQIENSKLLDHKFDKNLKEGGITHVKDFLNLTILEANNILKIGIGMTKNYIKLITKKIEKALIILNEKRENKLQAKKTHIKLDALTQEITKKETIKKYLGEEILYREQYNELSKQEQKTNKHYKYTTLELNNYELKILKQYIFNQITIEDINKNPINNDLYLAVINIYNKLTYYIEKLKYKEILKQNYYELNSLELTNAEQNSLKRKNIFNVSDIIEYSKETLKNQPIMSYAVYKKVLKELEEKNIVFLDNEQQILENLNQENAGIKKQRQK